jgi:hypothetical protein
MGNVGDIGIRQGGEYEFSIRLMDVEARFDLPEELPRARYNMLS